jgi:hypothetical protein
MRKRLVGLAVAGAVMLATGATVLLTGHAAQAKQCPSMKGAWLGTITANTPAGLRTFQSRIAFADGAVTEITTSPRQDPVLGTFVMSTGVGAYVQDCQNVRFTFTKYLHAPSGALLAMVEVNDSGVLSDGQYSGNAHTRRLNPDGTPMTDANGNPIVFEAASTLTRIQV